MRIRKGVPLRVRPLHPKNWRLVPPPLRVTLARRRRTHQSGRAPHNVASSQKRTWRLTIGEVTSIAYRWPRPRLGQDQTKLRMSNRVLMTRCRRSTRSIPPCQPTTLPRRQALDAPAYERSIKSPTILRAAPSLIHSGLRLCFGFGLHRLVWPGAAARAGGQRRSA